MNVLKIILSFILVLQLLIVLTILTQRSLKKVGSITNSHHLFNTELSKKGVLKVIKRNNSSTLASNIKRYSSIRKDIEHKAKRFLGKPYVWGATGPECFDCSGFTQKVYRAVGINLPRVSRNQARVGKLVRFNELKKGDMVFFDTSKKRVGRVNHFGIYHENGKFIHASSGKHRVVITNFSKKRFYKNRFLWGRRVIPTSTNKIAI